MKRTIYLPKPLPQELERIEEIKFYLFSQKLTALCRGAGLEDDLSIFRDLIQITKTSENLMLAAFREINTVSCKPHDIEVAVTARHLNWAYSFVQRRLMHSRKYQSLVLKYIDEREQNYLNPKLPEQLTNEVIKFNKEFYEHCGFIFAFLNSEVVFKEQERWDE